MSASPAPIREQPLLPGDGAIRPARPAWRSRLTRLDVTATPYLMIAPFFILFGAFGLFPLLYNVVVSFRTWKLDAPDKNGWAGLQNYSGLLGDDEMWNALKNTVGLFVLSSVPQLLAALILAAVLNRRLRFQTFFRMGVLLPYTTPIVASTLVFGAVFARETGIVDSLLGQPIDWRADIWSSWFGVVTMVNWRWTGYWAIIFLAAMQSVPRDLYEAATVDGAGVWTQFWRITVPLLRPAILFAVVISTIGGLQLFAEPLFFDEGKAPDANGGSDHQFQTIGIYIYKVAWKNLDLGSAAAISVGLFVLIVVLTALNAWVTSRLARGGRS
jgi:cellobiose transport system permease protein